MVRQWLVGRGWGLGVGLGLTAAAVVLHLSGMTERIELEGYDFYVRRFSRIPGSDRIVHIDIDDDALDRVGSWPWPRDIQAELIRILAELGADRIAMDIVWSEPKPPEVRLPALDPYAELEGEIDQVGELSEENLVYPDDELARAIADAGNVYLATYYEDAEPQPGEGAAGAGLPAGIAELLQEDFELDEEAIARRLGQPIQAVAAVLPGVKRRVARQRVRAELEADPSPTLREVHAAILTKPFNRRTADRADVITAYHQERGLRELRRRWPPVPDVLKGRLPRAGRVAPPVYKFIPEAQRVAFATFKEDAIDGITRHIPLMAEWEGLLIEQLAFAVARDVLDIRLEDLAMDGSGDLRISARGDRPAMRVQLDRERQMLVNWHTRPQRWPDCFAHLPVTQLLRIYDCRKHIKENEILKQVTLGRAIRLVKDDAGYERYRRQYNTMLKKERSVRLAKLRGQELSEELKRAATEAARLRRITENDRRETLTFITETWAELEGQPDPNDPAIADEYRRFREANALISGKAAELGRVNEELVAEQRRLIDEFRPLVAGKICFVGYTATAVADMVTTPAYRRMPGVLVHSNVLNSFLQGQFRTWSGRATQAVVIVLFGVLVSVITVTRGPKASLILAATIITVSFGLNALVAFRLMDHWLGLLTGLGLTFVAWALVVLFRYLVTDRQRRRLGKAVAQYVSPAMARRIAESGAKLDLSPVGGVATCFFSDLQGFTTISERLGPEGTRALLNPYLEAMSTILHRQQALINKFMGDGIFAFFNSPILPCPQHELAACAAALDSRQALRDLAARHAHHPLAREFQRLFMRVGIASGPVFVGDYGSENKLDYTCMGDTVNLASRLEGANKQFGSAIMLAGATREAVDDRYVYRHLGALQVKGRTAGVQVYELVGLRGEVDAELLRFAETYGRAVAAFTRRDWRGSRTAFESCLQLRPHDPGAIQYLKAIGRHDDNPPPDDWNGTLELTEK